MTTTELVKRGPCQSELITQIHQLKHHGLHKQPLRVARPLPTVLLSTLQMFQRHLLRRRCGRLAHICLISSLTRPPLAKQGSFSPCAEYRSREYSLKAKQEEMLKKLFSTKAEVVKGQSGQVYTIEKILQDKGRPLGCVYLANDGARSVVLKEIPQNFSIRTGIYSRARNCPHVRSLLDTVPDRRMFVFEYLNEDLLHLAQKDLPSSVKKHILKCALQGLAALHERDIVHNDIKANNIMVQVDSYAREVKVDKVQLVDLEDSAHVPPGKGIKGAQLGNEMWRSPESHAMGPIQKPSDMFSFGIVCIYAMTQALLFAVDDSELKEGVLKQAVIIERQISYFADEDGFMGLMKYLGPKNEYLPIFEVSMGGFGEEQPRKPFILWEGLNLDQEDLFKDLVIKLTNFDPTKRLTAQQALEHEWFKEF